MNRTCFFFIPTSRPKLKRNLKTKNNNNIFILVKNIEYNNTVSKQITVAVLFGKVFQFSIEMRLTTFATTTKDNNIIILYFTTWASGCTRGGV